MLNPNNLKSLKSKIKLLFVICLLAQFNNVFAQSGVTPISQNKLTQLMDENKFKGLPVYSGINSEWIVTTKNERISTQDSLLIIQNLATLKDFVSCNFKPFQHSLVVITKKEDNVNMIKNIKEKVVPFRIRIADYKETIYKSNPN